MNILFWGTPAYAVASLNALVAAGHQLVGVVSQPDRRRGRGKQLQASPVKARALELGIPVFTPERIRRDLDCQAQLQELAADVYVVVAFGQILPAAVLAQPAYGCWNGHGSLLPRWRGAGPIQWCLIEGDRQTGVGIMAMEEGLDTGPVLLEQAIPIGLRDNAQQLTDRLASLTGALLVQAMPLIEAAGPGPEAERLARLGVRAQGEQGITYARMLHKDDYQIDWSASALAIHRQVMGLYPGAHCFWRGRRLKVLDSEPLVTRLGSELSPEAAELAQRWAVPPAEASPGAEAAPGLVGAGPLANSDQPGKRAAGQVLEVAEGVGLVVATGGCPLLIRTAQLEGKQAVSGSILLQQLDPVAGDQLDT
jgi:methionyl-tRNA formyltransferase